MGERSVELDEQNEVADTDDDDDRAPESEETETEEQAEETPKPAARARRSRKLKPGPSPIRVIPDDTASMPVSSDEPVDAFAKFLIAQNEAQATRAAAIRQLEEREASCVAMRKALGLTPAGSAPTPSAPSPAPVSAPSRSRTRKRAVRKAVATVASSDPAPAKTKTGRLPRRSAEDVARTLAEVVAAIQRAGNDGMRAEQIRAVLGMNANELPRILKAGLEDKTLRSKGQKRATTYFVK